MSQMSDRALFLQTIKSEPLTINDIINRFGVARNTARNWIKLDGVVSVKGSWPTLYTREEGLELPAVKSAPAGKSKDKGFTFHYPIEVPEATIKDLFEKIMGDEVPHTDINDKFRQIDSMEKLLALKNMVFTWLVVIEYFEKQMREYENGN